MRLPIALAVLLTASHASANQCVPSADVPGQLAALDADNAKARDTALAAVGLTYAAVPLAAQGGKGSKPANTIAFKVKELCDRNASADFVFATDRAGNVVRVMPRTTSSEAARLRRENDALRRENQQLRAVIEARNKQLEAEAKQLTTQMK